jgi:hypothetical protein
MANMRQIDELSLWIGTARDARDIKHVLDRGIKAIVDLALEEPPINPTRELVYLRFPLIDGNGNPQWLLRAVLATVDGLILSHVPTLITCGAGMSRSPAVAAVVAARFIELEPVDVLVSLQNHGPIDVSPTLLQELLAVRSGSPAEPHSRLHNHQLTIHNESD